MISLYDNWISVESETKLIELCTTLGTVHGHDRVLRKDNRSLVMRFGPGMDYADRRVSQVIPAQLYALCARLASEFPDFLDNRTLKPIFDREPDSVTINKYEVGASLDHHVDHPNGGDVIATLGLGGDGVLEFRKPNGDLVAQPSSRRGLVVFSGIERTHWTHAMLPVSEERWSIVFRACRPQHVAQRRT